MYKFRKQATSLVVFVFFLLLFTQTAFAASTEYGLSVDITTAKATYTADSTARVHITVENTNSFEVKNVTIQHVIPAGLKQIDSTGLKTTKNLAAGEKLEFNVDVAPKGLLSETPDNGGSTSTATNTDTSPAGKKTSDKSSKGTGSSDSSSDSNRSRSGSIPGTGDDFNILLWVTLLAVSAAIIIVLIVRKKQSGKKKKVTTIISFFLCAALTLTAIPYLPGNSATADSNTKSFETTKTFKIGNNSYAYKVIVSYEEGSNHATIADYNFDSFHNASLGRGGDTSVNDFNGDLTHTFDDISMNGNRLPISVNHIYNLQGDDYSGSYGEMKLGKGWRLSTIEQIVPTEISAYPYRVIDEYGESHYFKRALRENGPDVDGNPYEDHSFVEKDSIESDPDMISWGFREEIDTNGNLTGFHMFYPDFREYIFNANGYLVKVIDPDGIDEQVYTYANGRLIKITDPAGREVTFTYDTKGYLTKMTDPSGRDLAYSYDTINDTLTKVTYPDGKAVNFTYDSKGELTSVTDIDNAKLEYEYTDGRVSKLTDNGTEGGLDFYYAFVYKELETIITDDDDGVETIKFNPDGSVIDEDDEDEGIEEDFPIDSIKDTTRSEYNANKDLVKISEKDENGNWTVTYEADYDGKHNMLWKITEGTKTTYTYDAFSNVTKQQVEKAPQKVSTKVYARVSTQDSQTTSVEEWTYSTDGNHLTKYTDTFGNEVRYNYDSDKGTLNWIEYPNGNKFELAYDANTDKLLSVRGQDSINTVSFENDNISSLSSTNGTAFAYLYDQFDKHATTKVGANKLVNKTYDAKRNLSKINCGNGQTIEPISNSDGQITGVKYDGVEKYKWAYDEDDNITKHVDVVNNVTWSYEDDNATASNGVAFTRQSNDDESDFTENTYLGELKSKNEFFYDSDGYLIAQSITGRTGATQDQKTTVAYGYDKQIAARNLASKIIKNGSATIGETVFTYASGLQGSETSRVKEVQNPGNNTSFACEYDANGNVTTVKDKDTNTVKIRYTYNDLNWLMREDNSYADKTYVYEYDNSGNITAKKTYALTTSALGAMQDTLRYTYGVNNLPGWNDVLSSFDGKQIIYDEISNPLTYDGYTFTWENVRQLSGISGNGKTIENKYNANGIRVQKTVNGVVTDYVVDASGTILQEKTGNDSNVFEYDVDGKLLSMKHNDVVYYYILNLQGDVIGMMDSSGTQVAEYAYDAWGNTVSSSGAIADVNPFGYRGYYKDAETGLHYLQSRYYNAQWGRFINADTLFDTRVGLTQPNLFCYVGNNPVNMIDPTGFAGYQQSVCKRLALDFDGAPTAYAPKYLSGTNTPNNANERDKLANAGDGKGTWWGVVTDKKTGDFVYRWVSKDKGIVYHVSPTSLMDGDYKDQSSYVDSLTVPYIVYKRKKTKDDEGDKGKVFLVVRKRVEKDEKGNKKEIFVASSFAIAADHNGDTGFPYASNGKGKGEGSYRLLRNLGAPKYTTSTFYKKGYKFYVYKFIGDYTPFYKKSTWNESTITSVGSKLAKESGLKW